MFPKASAPIELEISRLKPPSLISNATKSCEERVPTFLQKKKLELLSRYPCPAAMDLHSDKTMGDPA